MNGQAARRIRHASEKSRRPVKELKREYMREPYHQRALPVTGVPRTPHRVEECNYRAMRARIRGLL